MSEFWIPITAILSVTFAAVTLFILSAKYKSEVQNTIRMLLEKGNEITPELLEKLGTFKSQKVIDLRRGLALSALGLACVASGFIMSEPRPGLAIGIFPIMLGAAFLVTWKLNRYDD
jgi:cell division protein FtsW (lipid II flippase)